MKREDTNHREELRELSDVHEHLGHDRLQLRVEVFIRAVRRHVLDDVSNNRIHFSFLKGDSVYCQ